jgi:hypothetical protein
MPVEVHKLHRPINKLNKYETDPTGTSIVRNTCQGRRSLGGGELAPFGGGGQNLRKADIQHGSKNNYYPVILWYNKALCLKPSFFLFLFACQFLNLTT